MRIVDLYFASTTPLWVPVDPQKKLFPDNKVVHITRTISQTAPYTYFVEDMLVTLTPKDGTYLDRLLDTPSPRQYFFVVDHYEDHKMCIRPYLVNIWDKNRIKDFYISCSEQVLTKTPEDILKKRYLCEDDYFKNSTFFILQENQNNCQVQKYMFVSQEKLLLVERHNNLWEVIKEIDNEHKIYADWALLCVSVSDIHFQTKVDNKERKVLEEQFDELSRIADQKKSFLELWNTYEELEKLILAEEEKNFGKVGYNSYRKESKPDGTVEYTFKLNEKPGRYPKKISLAYWDGTTDKRKRGALIGVGTLIKQKDDQFITSADSAEQTVPNSGYLVVNIIGDENIHKRRESAKKCLQNSNAAISNLAEIINAAGKFEGPVDETVPRKPLEEKYKGLSSKFMEEHPETKKIFENENQLKALTMAINTPDIAVIKGPPGTGKTTIIRAIKRRFEDIFLAEEEKKEKEATQNNKNYQKQSPKVCMGGFQNNAVDNAVKIKDPKDFPAYRVISTNRVSDDYDKDITKWVENSVNKLKIALEDPTFKCYSETLTELDQRYKTFCINGKSLQEGKNILQEYMQTFQEYIPSGLQGQIQQLITPVVQTNLDADADLPEEFSLRKLLRMQPLSRNAFEDGGREKVKKLYNFVLLNESVNGITDPIKSNLRTLVKMELTDPTFDSVFRQFIQDVSDLKEIYCSPEQSPQKDLEQVEAIIKTLPKTIENKILEAVGSPDKDKMAHTFIAARYLERFEREYKQLIKKYSNVTAATCQKAGAFEFKDTKFDLAIIDEAARAVPLDLFIPMIKAKKIILVGDQNQLNHMISSEVEKKLKERNEQDKLELLRTSLFDKLYRYLWAQGKSIELTDQFRYNDTICQFISEQFYHNKLKSGKLDPEKTTPQSGLYDNQPLVAVNISGGNEIGSRQNNINNDTNEEVFSSSISRPAEVDQIMKDLSVLLKNCNGSVGIITFYAAQREALSEAKRRFNENEQKRIKIGTVDSFQGDERDYIMLSCVRSNKKRKVGFLDSKNRLCVAFSRALRQLIVYGDKETITNTQTTEAFTELYHKYEKPAIVHRS